MDGKDITIPKGIIFELISSHARLEDMTDWLIENNLFDEFREYYSDWDILNTPIDEIKIQLLKAGLSPDELITDGKKLIAKYIPNNHNQ
jgi:hypothetical protein